MLAQEVEYSSMRGAVTDLEIRVIPGWKEIWWKVQFWV